MPEIEVRRLKSPRATLTAFKVMSQQLSYSFLELLEAFYSRTLFFNIAFRIYVLIIQFCNNCEFLELNWTIYLTFRRTRETSVIHEKSSCFKMFYCICICKVVFNNKDSNFWTVTTQELLGDGKEGGSRKPTKCLLRKNTNCLAINIWFIGNPSSFTTVESLK